MADRGRRTSRLSGDERQQAILTSAEALLEKRSLEDLSIGDIASGAGISRSSFYFYFTSKDEVLLALLDRVISEVEGQVAALPRDFDSDPGAAWRRSIGIFVDVFAAHRAVSTAAIASRSRNPEAQQLWSRSMQAWTDYATEVIVAERKRGGAPEGVDARDLAITLNLMNERVISAALSGETPSVDQHHVLDVLAHVWTQSIYGHSDPTPEGASHHV